MTATCANCGSMVEQAEDVPADDRISCPECGSTSRAFARTVHEHLETHVTLRTKLKRQGKGKPVASTVSGDSFDRDSGRWLEIEQVVDREKNLYRKKIVDPKTGEVLRDDDGPLTGHQGFGSAKRRGSAAHESCDEPSSERRRDE